MTTLTMVMVESVAAVLAIVKPEAGIGRAVQEAVMSVGTLHLMRVGIGSKTGRMLAGSGLVATVTVPAATADVAYAPATPTDGAGD